MTYEDKCTDPSEIKRVKNEGGVIVEERLGGILAVSRAIGDHDLKGAGLSCKPHITKHLINSNDRCCVLASDGVWDVITEEMIYNYAQKIDDPEILVEKIIQESINFGSTDNISCIVIYFNKN